MNLSTSLLSNETVRAHIALHDGALPAHIYTEDGQLLAEVMLCVIGSTKSGFSMKGEGPGINNGIADYVLISLGTDICGERAELSPFRVMVGGLVLIEFSIDIS